MKVTPQDCVEVTGGSLGLRGQVSCLQPPPSPQSRPPKSVVICWIKGPRNPAPRKGLLWWTGKTRPRQRRSAASLGDLAVHFHRGRPGSGSLAASCPTSRLSLELQLASMLTCSAQGSPCFTLTVITVAQCVAAGFDGGNQRKTTRNISNKRKEKILSL